LPFVNFIQLWFLLASVAIEDLLTSMFCLLRSDCVTVSGQSKLVLLTT